MRSHFLAMILLTLLASPAAFAQGGPDDVNQPQPENLVEENPFDSNPAEDNPIEGDGSADNPIDGATDSSAASDAAASGSEPPEGFTEEQWEQWKKDIALALDALEPDRRKGHHSLLVRNRLQLGISGTADFEYRHAQKNARAGSFLPPVRKPNGMELDEVLLSFDARYGELNSRRLGEFNLTLELFEDRVELDQAWLSIDGIFSRIRIPGATEVISNTLNDNLRLGLSPVFWRDQHSPAGSFSLLDQALARDEQIMLQYTAAISNHFYAVLGLSEGSVLALDGEIDGSSAWPMLADDRTAYFENRGDENWKTSRPELHFGLGTAICWKEGATPMRGSRPFHPSALGEQADLVTLQVWGSHDRMSQRERDLVSLAYDDGPDASRAKWRIGANAGFAWLVDERSGHLLRARAEYAHARDGALARDFYGVQISFAYLLGETTPFLYGVEPYARFGALLTNQEGPSLRETAIQVEYTGALIAGDRLQYTIGVNLKLARLVMLRLEYSANRERFNTPRGVSSGVSNDLLMLALNARF